MVCFGGVIASQRVSQPINYCVILDYRYRFNRTDNINMRRVPDLSCMYNYVPRYEGETVLQHLIIAVRKPF